MAAGLAVVAADPALARAKHKAKRHCIDRPHEISWHGVFFNPAPRPNGCAPPVFVSGNYIGQVPDTNIRFQLMRDPRTGYSSY
ncbi:MAG: hypothetical protein EXQ82_11930 [Pseudolabrys sp.]|nr:hypothetical protein [Pseudolabrys sp.]